MVPQTEYQGVYRGNTETRLVEVRGEKGQGEKWKELIYVSEFLRGFF